MAMSSGRLGEFLHATPATAAAFGSQNEPQQCRYH